MFLRTLLLSNSALKMEIVCLSETFSIYLRVCPTSQASPGMCFHRGDNLKSHEVTSFFETNLMNWQHCWTHSLLQFP